MKRLIPAVGLLGLALLFAACSGGAANQPSAGGSIDPNAIQISAKDLKFSTSTLSAPANKPFQIAFDNQDAAPHNVAIYTDSSFSNKVFGQDPFGGPKVVTYNVQALAPGTYAFRCDVHPDMKGSLEVK